jgi:hypothetical protein
MTASRDWLPSNHEALYDKAKQAAAYLSESTNRTRMGFEAGTSMGNWFDTVFIPAYTSFKVAFETWLNPAMRTPLFTATLIDKQKMFSAIFRKFYTGFLKDSPLVTNTDRVAMGLPEHSSGGHTPAPVPMTVPEAKVLLPSPAVVEIHFRDAGARRKGKPAGVHGVEIAWAVLDTPPIDWAELIHTSFDTRTPYRFSFEGDLRGKRLYIALRWENTRGVKGPWSAIQEIIIS